MRIRKHACITVLYCLLLLTTAWSQTGVDKTALAVLDSFRTRFDLPGITATVILKNGTAIDVSTGVSDLATQTALTPQHKLLSGSTGKMYFAISILKLAAEGKLHLDDLASKYLGKHEWYSKLPNASSITIRQLLNHTAGMEEYYGLGDFTERLQADPDKEWKIQELVSYVSGRQPLFEAGTSFSYADTHYLLLQAIIEEITGRSAYDFIHKNIIQKIALKNTVPSISRTIPGMANGYSNPQLPTKIDGPLIRDGKMVVNPQFEGGGGGFASTSHDLATLVHNLMNGKLLPQEMLEEMKKEVAAPKLGKNQFYGLGLQIVKAAAGTTYGHSGWFPGYMSDVEYFSNNGITIAVQINADHSKKGNVHPRAIAFRIANALNQSTNSQ